MERPETAEHVNPESDPYAQLAPFYDLGHAHLLDDVDLYDALARRSNGKVLELGAGTGRVAIALAQRGHAVTGIDRSETMLEIARRKATALGLRELRLLHEDMRTPSVVGPFGLVVCAIDTFLHLLTVDDQLRTLGAVAERLSPNGLLVLDLPGPAGDWNDWQTGARPLVLDWSAVDAGRRISRFTTFRADPTSQIRHIIDIFEQVDASGGVRRQIVEYDLRFIFPAEAELLLRLAGLRRHACWGDYNLGAFDGDSPRMLVVATR